MRRVGDSAIDPCTLTVGTNGWISSFSDKVSESLTCLRVGL